MLRSVWSVWFDTNQGAFVIVLRIFYCDRCMVATLDLLAHPHSSIPHVQMGLITNNLFSNSSGRQIFRIPPERPLEPSSRPYNGYRVSFPGVKRPGGGVDHKPQYSAEIRGRVELYLYCSIWAFTAFIG